MFEKQIPTSLEENYIVHSSVCCLNYVPNSFSLTNVEERISISGVDFVCKFSDSSVIISQSKMTVPVEDINKVRHQIQTSFSMVIQKLEDKYDVEFSFKELIRTNVM